jgi:hypothetical protein
VREKRFWKMLTNVKVISVLIILAAAVMAVIGWHEAKEYEKSVLAIYAQQQDAYVQLVLDQINVLDERSDEEIVQKILGSLDTSGRKYWTLTKDQALLFVKDVTETNRYKGLTTETFFTSDSAARFLQDLEINRVIHETIQMDGVRYVASGVIFEYNSAEYKICLLTNDTVILDNNIFLSSKIGLYVFGVLLLGLLLVVSMIFANVLDLREKRMKAMQEHITGLNKMLTEQTEMIREMNWYHTRWSVFKTSAMEMFVQKIVQRQIVPVVFVSVAFDSEKQRNDFLQKAQILLDEKVVRFERESGDGLILLFLQYQVQEMEKALEQMTLQKVSFRIERRMECREASELQETYGSFMAQISQEGEKEHGADHVSGI